MTFETMCLIMLFGPVVTALVATWWIDGFKA
jgi:hypothetical protein